MKLLFICFHSTILPCSHTYSHGNSILFDQSYTLILISMNSCSFHCSPLDFHIILWVLVMLNQWWALVLLLLGDKAASYTLKDASRVNYIVLFFMKVESPWIQFGVSLCHNSARVSHKFMLSSNYIKKHFTHGWFFIRNWNFPTTSPALLYATRYPIISRQKRKFKSPIHLFYSTPFSSTLSSPNTIQSLTSFNYSVWNVY